jgi:hypothetical protein
MRAILTKKKNIEERKMGGHGTRVENLETKRRPVPERRMSKSGANLPKIGRFLTSFFASLLTGLFATLSAKREQGPHCRPHGRLTRCLQARLILSGIEPTGVNPREKRGKNAAF